MNEQELFRAAYNAHEKAEAAACEAMYEELRKHSVDALACLADPKWSWQTRSWMSATITDYASEALDEKLETLVAA